MTRPAPSCFAAVTAISPETPVAPRISTVSPRVAERRGNIVGNAVGNRKAELRIDQAAFGHGAERPDGRIDVEIDAPAVAIVGDAFAADDERAVRHLQIMQAD